MELIQRYFLHITVLATAGLAVAAFLGWVGTALLLLGAAIVTELALAGEDTYWGRALTSVAAGPRTRALTRALLVAVLFAVAFDALTVAAYVAVVLAIQAGYSMLRFATMRTRRDRPPLAVRNLDLPPDLNRLLTRTDYVAERASPWAAAADFVSVVALAIAAYTTGSWTATVVVAGLACVAVLAFAVAIAWSLLASVRSEPVANYESSLFAALEDYAPAAIVYLSAGEGQSGYILNQWLPALDNMRQRAFVLVREAHQLGPIGETKMPIIYAPSTRDVERLVLPTVNLAFYLANAGRNVHLLREPRIKHVFLNHGDSDKSTSANPVSRVYDEVWVAGEAAIDRYHQAGIDIPRSKFAIVGRPQVQVLDVGPRNASDRCILYAPTFEGYYEESNYSSLEVMGPKMIRRLLGEFPDVRIVFKPHPYTGKKRAQMRRAREKVEAMLREAARVGPDHLLAEDHPDMTLYDCFDLADVLVSDISSVVTDFLQTERPIITSNPRGLPHDQYREMFTTQRASYIVDPDLSNLDEVVRAALGDDPMAADRRAMKTYVLGDHDEGPMGTFADEVDRINRDAVQHASRVKNAFKFDEQQLAEPIA